MARAVPWMHKQNLTAPSKRHAPRPLFKVHLQWFSAWGYEFAQPTQKGSSWTPFFLIGEISVSSSQILKFFLELEFLSF